ncbi:MAG: Appr-1-p processing protein [Luteolibacter sp.]
MITYKTGDASWPELEPGTYNCIAHVCNDKGGWGAGFVLALSRISRSPELKYRKYPKDRVLGRVQWCRYTPGLYVVNMIAQHGYGPERPLSYSALHACLRRVGRSLDEGDVVHMPRIGCGLAGGSWAIVRLLVWWNLCRKGMRVIVYDLP